MLSDDCVADGTTENSCVLLKSRPVHSGGAAAGIQIHHQSWGKNQRTEEEQSVPRATGSSSNLLLVAQTAVSQQHQLNSRSAAF